MKVCSSKSLVGALYLIWIWSCQPLFSETLESNYYREVIQSTDDPSGNHAASRAVDGLASTFSLTDDVVDSYWQVTLKRARLITRIELVNRADLLHEQMGNQILRVFNIDDQSVYSTVVTNPGSGGTWVVDLPPNTRGRIIRYGLEGGQANIAGNYRSPLAEISITASNDLFAPVQSNDLRDNGTASQSSLFSSSFPASNALDGNPGSFTHTQNIPDSYWQLTLDNPEHITQIELVNRADCCAARMGGLTLRIFDGDNNSIDSSPVPNPGPGGTWIYNPPAGTTGQVVRVGLEGGAQNDDGNYYVTLAEVRLPITGVTNTISNAWSNLAVGATSYMVRLADSVTPASNANDDDLNTEATSYVRTVGAWWEVDLGETYAIYGVQSIAASGPGDRIANCTLRLYDDLHDSIYAEPLDGGSGIYNNDVGGPILTRYVRIGLEDKRRTAAGVEWYIGFKEVRALGRPANEVGLLGFSASTNEITSGQPVTLNWDVHEVHRVELYPGIGSVGALTDTSGAGSIVLNPTTSTEYILVATGPFFTNTMAVTVEVDSQTLPLRISEFVAQNRYSLEDGYGNAPEWIEIHNPNNTSIDMLGHGLSDDPLTPMKWTFPSAIIPPHGHLIVFASGQNDPVDPVMGLHTEAFSLNNSGESVVLTAPDGTTTVDAILNYPPQERDLAYGHDPEGNLTFIEPTPMQFNLAQSWLGWLEPLKYSHSRGYYDAPFTLTLSNANAGATALYSLDGQEPNAVYTTGLDISRTMTVRSQVTKPGFKSPQSRTHTYLFIDDVIANTPWVTPSIVTDPQYADRLRQGLLDLPTVSIAVPGGNPNYPETPGSVEFIFPDTTDNVQENCGVSRFGGAWTTFAKRNFRLKFRAEYGKAKIESEILNGFDRGFISQTRFDSLDLQGGGHDMNQRGFYMAARFTEDSLLDMGSLNPHGRFVHLYINGTYWGQFHLHERMVRHFLADYLGGTDDDYVNVLGNDNIGDNFVLGTPTPPNREGWEYVRAHLEDYQNIKQYLDVQHYIDFMILWFYGNCETEFRAAGPVAPGSGFKFWMNDADGFLRTSANGLNRTGNDGPGFIFDGLTTERHPDFMMLLADRIYKHLHNDGALMPHNNAKRLDDRMLEIENSLIAECARWGYRTPENWQQAEDAIQNNLFPVRTDQLLSLLRNAGFYPALNPPAFNQYGGTVSAGFQPELTTATGTIYYTINGTDPRLPGGGISPGAMIWSPGSLTITQDLVLTVRVRTLGGSWSAAATPEFRIDERNEPLPGDLLITEIMYHPVGEGLIEGEEFEFLELKNVTTNVLDLGGITFDGINFTFTNGTRLAPGGFFLLGRNPAQLAARYPGIVVNGVYTGKLSNGGERLDLFYLFGDDVLSVNYSDGGRWPVTPDGFGFSLVPRDPNLNPDPDSPSNWRASTHPGGSPGADDPDPVIPPILVNEVLTHTDPPQVDAIELHNPTVQDINIEHWFLTDDRENPFKFRMPPGSSEITAGGYLVLTETNFNPTPGSGTSFTLSSLGEEVYLLSGDANTNLTGYSHGFKFGAAANGVSFGRHIISTGEEQYPAQASLTLGGPNSLPLVGPVVVRQIMFHPPPLPGGIDTQLEYLELRNITGSDVDLFDPAFPTNTWKLRDAVNYPFPPGTTLPVGGSLLVVSFDPADAGRLAAFYNRYPLLSGIPLYGPFAGKLDNGGESVELARPDTPELDEVPFILVDKIEYKPTWAAPADGLGAALQRVLLVRYGNDPANWISAAPLTFFTQPQGLTVSPGADVTMSVLGVGTGILTYQWRFNGISIPGETGASIQIFNAQEADEGAYTVEMTDQFGSIISAPAYLGVLVDPYVIQPPVSQSVVQGGSVTFSIQVGGNLPMSYRWRRSFFTVTNETTFSKSSYLTINNVQLADAGPYTVVLTNAAFFTPGVLSAAATLTVLPDTDLDGQPDEWETLNDLSVDVDDAGGNADGDILTNLEEYIAGTDPNDPDSYLKVESIDANAVITFEAKATKTYTIEYTDNLGGPWTKLADVPARDADYTATVTDPNPGNQRYYRLVTPRQP